MLFVSKAFIVIAFRFEELIEVRLAVDIPTQRCVRPKAVWGNTKSNVSTLCLGHPDGLSYLTEGIQFQSSKDKLTGFGSLCNLFSAARSPLQSWMLYSPPALFLH